jgi:AraC-like DNA-binding protein
MITNSFFQTFGPINSVVSRFVSYYYVDIKPENTRTEFTCFPHYNNSISLYRSHIRTEKGEMLFDAEAPAYQIFTPIRTKPMRVRQLGKVHRVVIVFNPLGMQQFYRGLDVSKLLVAQHFFDPAEIRQLFSTVDPVEIASLLDGFLFKRYQLYLQEIVSRSIESVFLNLTDFSVEALAEELMVSRRHLSRIFKTNLGVSVKQFHNIVLFRRAMEEKMSIPVKTNFTRLAYELNFSDQSHLNKMFKKLTQTSPNEFFRNGTALGDRDLFWRLHTR